MASWEERTYKILSNDPVIGGSWDKAIFQALKVAGEETIQLLPSGGSSGQVLSKSSVTDYDATWVDAQAGSPTWDYYATTWSTAPTFNQAITGGSVYDYTLSGTTRYRFVPSPYDPTQDAFYTTFSGGVLSGLITTRG